MEKGLNYIINLFDDNKKYTFEEIVNECKKVDINDVNTICKLLDKLKIKGIIYEKKDIFGLFPENLVMGTLEITDNFNIVHLLNDDVIVDDSDLNEALDGDLVAVKIGNDKCKIDGIIKRKDGLVTVEVAHRNGEIYFNPKNVNLKHKIVLNKDSGAFVDGDLFLVKIGEKLEDNCYTGEFVDYLGHINDPCDELELIAKENSITIDFSQEALDEVEDIPYEVTPEDMKDRLDLTKELIFSIDGKHTKDRDDAISLTLDKDGNYILGVHIADVSHYVYPGMKLWDEAMDRSTSVYLANSVIPMLPHKLSNGICSLNPDVLRLTYSCIAKISPKGQILEYRFANTVIKSKRALTYDEANDIIDGKEITDDSELKMTLRMMNQLSNILELNKVKRGYIDFGCNDVIIDIDGDNNPVDMKVRVRSKAEKLIANFMQIASECAADYVELPAPYRVHDKPEIEDVLFALDTLDNTGIQVVDTDDVVNPKTIQRILNHIKNTPDRDIAANIILKAMKPARYSPFNSGHYGLGLEKYSQFTSPIRRASDLMLHVVMKNVQAYSYSDMSDFCRHATHKEMNAINANREAIRYEMKRYVEDHHNDKFPAIVTFINSSGIFIKTSQGIDGKLAAQDIEGDIFRYDSRTNTFKGKRTGYRINIGTRLVLTPLESTQNKTISFGLSDADLLTLKRRRH